SSVKPSNWNILRCVLPPPPGRLMKMISAKLQPFSTKLHGSVRTTASVYGTIGAKSDRVLGNLEPGDAHPDGRSNVSKLTSRISEQKYAMTRKPCREHPTEGGST